MSIDLVNGYVCRDCGDVELAKRGIDPAHPKNAFHGSEAFAKDDSNDPVTAKKLGENKPNATGDVGTELNLLG